MDDSKGLGTHWCCIIRKNNHDYIYFDPFGMTPPKEVLNFNNLMYNTFQYEDKARVLCGYFCLVFVKKYSLNISPYGILYKELRPFDPLRNEQK